MIQVTISDVGTPPILALVVEFNAPEIFTRNFTAGPYLPRKTYNLEVTGLQDNTQYSFTVSCVNYQGRGKATTRYNTITGVEILTNCKGIICHFGEVTRRLPITDHN